MSDIWSRAWCQTTQTPNFALKGISALNDTKHPPDYVPRVFSTSTEFVNPFMASRTPTPEPDSFSCFPFIRKKRKPEKKTSIPATPAPRRVYGEKIPNFKAPPAPSPPPSAKTSVAGSAALITPPPLSPGRVKIKRTLSRTQSSNSSDYQYHLSPPESPRYGNSTPSSPSPWFAQGPVPPPPPPAVLTHPQHDPSQSFLETKIAEMARNSMFITGGIAQASAAEEYIDAHASPSPKLTITKDNGRLEYLETPMRNCAYSGPPTPRNSSNLSASSPQPGYGSDNPAHRSGSKLEQPSPRSSTHLSLPGQAPQQPDSKGGSQQTNHNNKNSLNTSIKSKNNTNLTKDLSNLGSQEECVQQYKAALMAQFDNPDIDQNRPFFLDQMYNQEQACSQEDLEEDEVSRVEGKGDTLTTYYSTRSHIRRRNTNSYSNPDSGNPSSSDQYDQGKRTNQIVYGDVNNKDNKRISGEFARIENLEAAARKPKKSVGEKKTSQMSDNLNGKNALAAPTHQTKAKHVGREQRPPPIPRIRLHNSDPNPDNQSIVFLGRDGSVLAESKLSVISSPTRVRRVRSSLMGSGQPNSKVEPEPTYPEDDMGVEQIEAWQLLKEISNNLETLKSRTNSPTEFLCYPLPSAQAAQGTEAFPQQQQVFLPSSAGPSRSQSKRPGRLGTQIPRQSTDDSHNSEDPGPSYFHPLTSRQQQQQLQKQQQKQQQQQQQLQQKRQQQYQPQQQQQRKYQNELPYQQKQPQYENELPYQTELAYQPQQQQQQELGEQRRAKLIRQNQFNFG